LGIKATSGDSTQLVYLRSRYYNPADGRFQSRDTWGGNDNSPQTLNKWSYVQNNPIVYTDPSGKWCVAGFSVGPGRECNEEETQRWTKFYFNQAFLLAKLMNHDDKDGQQIALGFAYEYLDTVLVLPIMSAFLEVGDQLNGCGSWSTNYYQGMLYNAQHSNSQWFIAGRYLATAVLVGQAMYEVGAGLGGISGGVGISIGSGGLAALVGIPVAEMSAILVGHGTLVLAAVAARNRINPLPPLNFAAMNGEGGGSGLIDGSTMSEEEILDAANEFLGPGYIDMGNGRFVSSNGLRQFRIGESDLLGIHGGGPHANFEILVPNPFKPGKFTIVEDIHIYIR